MASGVGGDLGKTEFGEQACGQAVVVVDPSWLDVSVVGIKPQGHGPPRAS